MDPWIHRSERMSCKTCMWYVPKQPLCVTPLTVCVGRCRKHAPAMDGYPVVYLTDWCGDHKLDENTEHPTISNKTATMVIKPNSGKDEEPGRVNAKKS